MRSLLLLALVCPQLFAFKADRVAHAPTGRQSTGACDRPTAGSVVIEPRDLSSTNHLLKVVLRARNSLDTSGHMRFCFVDNRGDQGPTLRVQPGDTLAITLENEISLPAGNASSENFIHQLGSRHLASHNPCSGGPMSAGSINLHFHGLSVPPVCHQDETLNTIIEPGDRPFEYRIKIPASQPPGLYWYHPHVHGYTEEQILGGASGAIIVEGMDRAAPRVAGLPQRVLIIRDEQMPDVPISKKPDPNKPTKQLTVNYVPVPYPNYPPAIIPMKPGAHEFWRVLNASADTFLNLGLEIAGKRQSIDLVAMDGVPIRYREPGAGKDVLPVLNIFLPPAARAEFIITAPPLGSSGVLLTHYVFRGAGDDGIPSVPKTAMAGVRTGQDDVDAARPLATIVTSDESEGAYLSKATPPQSAGFAFPPLSSVRPVRKRLLYFSEKPADPKKPNSVTSFFITEEGRTPAVFGPNTEPIVVRSGDVEDWTIENRSQEAHTFHVHQLHFLVVGSWGAGWEEPTPRDTVNVPAWNGFGRYPSITVRMDFRNPNIVGLVPFHCHILQHADGGMMGIIQIVPRNRPAGTVEEPLQRSLSAR